MAPDPLTEEQRRREFAKPPDVVPEPPRTDPALDPPGTVRVINWERRLARDVARAVKTDVGIWAQITGPSVSRTPYGRLLHDDVVASWHVVSWLTVAVAFQHTEHQRLIHRGPQDFGPPALPMSSDGVSVDQSWSLPGQEGHRASGRGVTIHGVEYEEVWGGCPEHDHDGACLWDPRKEEWGCGGPS